MFRFLRPQVNNLLRSNGEDGRSIAELGGVVVCSSIRLASSLTRRTAVSRGTQGLELAGLNLAQYSLGQSDGGQ